MRWFTYNCPDCGSSNAIHENECDHGDKSREEIEGAYLDIINSLLLSPKEIHSLRESESVVPTGPSKHEEWVSIHDDCLSSLRNEKRVMTRKFSDGGSVVEKYELLTRDEWADEMSKPEFEPMKTIYEKGSAPGAHDNSVFAMIAYYEMVGLSWEQTKSQVIEWMYESGTWDRGGFAESSPEELIETKYHVYENGYGWKEKAKAAKKVVDSKV